MKRLACHGISHSHDLTICCEKIHVNGIVQGVGFRPFVYKEACELGLSGSVINTAEGVEIEVQGTRRAIDRFKERLIGNPPQLADITTVRVEAASIRNLTGFYIEKSRVETYSRTLVSPDVALCDDCLTELSDFRNRRFTYPFTNCTNCGPRFTIVKSLPYDRKRTTMASFPMCPLCRAEYDDPGDRRFHTQATCCPVCGPRVWLVNSLGEPIPGESPLKTALSLIENGRILAVKGIGGFHLAADAANNGAVSRLRRLKARGDKPFAVMAVSLERARQFADISLEEEHILTSTARPIVILKKRGGKDDPAGIAPDVAPSNPMIGVMLPYAPLHTFLFNENVGVLVMTSANPKHDPIVCDNDKALSTLAGMADAFLLHDRDIHIRSDDSVGRWIGGSFRIHRRSRGYVPTPVTLTAPAPDILATGGIMKNTLCVVKGNSAFMGPHIGDLETPSGFGFFDEAALHMCSLFDVAPDVIVHDMHPDHITTDYGKHWPNAEKLAVQHHHAHIVSCMVENGYDGDVIGFAFDGTGYGGDGTVWGGEVLLAKQHSFQRASHIGCVAMPGGGAAVRDPFRMWISWLYHTFGEDMWTLDLPILTGTGSDPDVNRSLVRMITCSVNSPMTSSMGRLFDGVAAIMGLCRVNTFDGQAAMALEMCASSPDNARGYSFGEVFLDEENPTAVDMRPLIRAVVRDFESKIDPGVISARFHRTLIDIFAGIGVRLAHRTGIGVAALSGGVFQNARLLRGLERVLSEKGLTVLTHSRVPANDGGLSLGQAGIAAAICRNRIKL